jgi:hypothetical protein
MLLERGPMRKRPPSGLLFRINALLDRTAGMKMIGWWPSLWVTLANDTNVHSTFLKDELRSLKRSSPHRVVKHGWVSIETNNVGFNDCTGAIDAWEERGGHVGPSRGQTAPCRFKDCTTLSVFHPNEPAVTGVPLLEVPDARWESIAGRNISTVVQQEYHPDFADSIRTPGGHRMGPLHVCARCDGAHVGVTIAHQSCVLLLLSLGH